MDSDLGKYPSKQSATLRQLGVEIEVYPRESTRAISPTSRGHNVNQRWFCRVQVCSEAQQASRHVGSVFGGLRHKDSFVFRVDTPT